MTHAQIIKKALSLSSFSNEVSSTISSTLNIFKTTTISPQNVSRWLSVATQRSRLLFKLLQWSEMGILGPIVMRMLLLSHWALHRRQVFANVWNQDTRLTYFWSFDSFAFLWMFFDNFKTFRKFWRICLSFSSWWWRQQNYNFIYTQKLFLLGHPWTQPQIAQRRNWHATTMPRIIQPLRFIGSMG